MSKIINLSEAVSIALHGMILVYRSGKPLNAVQISEQIASSKHHVAKIMQRLAKEGLISSFRGPSGGFSLNTKSDEITLLAIYQAIEGPIESVKCSKEKPACSFESCIYGDIIEKMTCEFTNFLKSKKLSDYL